MKNKVLIIGVVFISLASVGMIFINKTNTSEIKEMTSNTKEIKEEKQNVSNMEKLTKEAFLEKVFNYEQNKEWKYEGELPCLIDFYADWCGPCKMMAPAYEAAAATLEPQVRLAKLNTEEAPAIAARFNIQSIPTIAIFQGGHETARQAGAMSQEQMVVRWVQPKIG